MIYIGDIYQANPDSFAVMLTRLMP